MHGRYDIKQDPLYNHANVISMLIFYMLLGVCLLRMHANILLFTFYVLFVMHPPCCAILCQLVFFKRDREFVDGRDTETGNTALHIASRHGHLVSVHHCTPSLSCKCMDQGLDLTQDNLTCDCT